MSKKSAQTELVPLLRFPEFRGREGWQMPQLAELYRFKRTNTLSRNHLNYETGTIKNIHYGDIHTKFRAIFRIEDECVPYVNPDASADTFDVDAYCEEGDIVLADASEDLNDVGKAIEIVSLDGQQVVAGTHTILATRRGDEPIVGFAGHLFHSAAVRAGFQKESQGAKVYGISANRISAVSVPLPPTCAEQRKIADCLGSLDDLIAAGERKLEALRDYKQGLMQQLFPHEGETRPRLRFPEFHSMGEWGTRRIGEFGDISMCKRILNGQTNDREGVPFYKIGTLGGKPDAYISRELYENYRARYSFPRKGEVLITCAGTVGKCVPYDGEDAYFQDSNIVWIENPQDEVTNQFLYPVLANIDWSKLNSTTITRIYLDDLRNLRIKVPPQKQEQNRIADCLASLDATIAAQAEKLDALRTHKLGLMQQLFPSPEDTAA